jgi:hypothetical protein
MLMGWTGNIFAFDGRAGGTGAARVVRIYAGTASTVNFDLSANSSSSLGYASVSRSTSAANSVHFSTNGNTNASTGRNVGMAVFNQITQSGSAAYTGLLINPLESSLGAGPNYLLHAGTATGTQLS